MAANEMSTVIDQLAETARFVRESFDAISTQDWDKRVEGVQFSMRQEMCHLRDVELEGYLVRVTRMAAEKTPVLLDIDGDRWARERDYETQDPESAARDFVALREMTVTKLRQLPAEAWARTGCFAPDVSFDLRELTAMMRHHDEEHCAEISLLVAALT